MIFKKQFLVRIASLENVLQDGMLSREEVVSHYTKFMGSQATDYGKAITRHEEL